jgi:hypothetical protein
MQIRQMPVALCLCAAAVACSPSLNWREVTPDGSGAMATFPCRPDQQSRRVTLSGQSKSMTQVACSVEHSRFALSYVDADDPAQRSAIAEQLRVAAVDNVHGSDIRSVAVQIPGTDRAPQVQRLSMLGRWPDGTALQQHVAIFAQGLRIYQATVIGNQPPGDAVETFFSGLRLSR